MNNNWWFNLIFIKLLYKYNIIYKKIFFYILYIKKIIKINILYTLYIIYLYNNILLLNKNNVLFKNKYIRKGVKLKNLNFFNNLKKKKLKNIKNLKSFNWIIYAKRKNLFLTFLNMEGDVVLKTNLGANGFKKRVKYTGYAIKNTCKEFNKKIYQYMIKYHDYLNNKLKEQINNQINQFLINKKLQLLFNKKNNFFIKNWFKYVFRAKRYFFIKKYRNYKFYKNRNWLRKKKISIKIQLMSEVSYWVIRFAIHGIEKLYKYGNYISKIEDRIHVSHSKGLRIRKMRRI